MHGCRVVRCRTLVVASSADGFAERVKGWRTLGSTGRTVLTAELEWIEIGAIVAVIDNLGPQMKRDARSVRGGRRLESIQAAVQSSSSVVSRFAVLTVADGTHFACDRKSQVNGVPRASYPVVSHTGYNKVPQKPSLQTIINGFDSSIVQFHTIVPIWDISLGGKRELTDPEVIVHFQISAGHVQTETHAWCMAESTSEPRRREMKLWGVCGGGKVEGHRSGF
jgi:hypothetical protein